MDGLSHSPFFTHQSLQDPDPMDNNQGTSLQHQQQGLQQQMQHQQQQQRPGKKRADRPLPAVYKIQLHLRKGEPLERRRLTHGLPDPDPYDHVRGQDSFVVLRERIVTRVSRHPELLWPDDSFPYIKPSESIPQKYYQQLSADNYENLMEKAWQMEAKRLPDEGLIVLNIFVYLKDREPQEPPGPRGRPVSAARAVATALAAPLMAPPRRPVGRPPSRPPQGQQAQLRPPGQPGRPPQGQVAQLRPPGQPRPRPPRPHPSQQGQQRPLRPPIGQQGPRRPGPHPLGPQGRIVRSNVAAHAPGSGVLAAGEAVVAALTSTTVIPVASTSPTSSSSASSSSSSSVTGPSSASTAFLSAPISSPIVEPAALPVLVSVALPPPTTRAQQQQSTRSTRHRLSAIPLIQPPLSSPPPTVVAPVHGLDEDRLDELMQEDVENDFDHDMDMHDDDDKDDDLPPRQMYDIHSLPPLPPQPQPQTQAPVQVQQQPLQEANDGNFRTIQVKMNGVLMPLVIDIQSLRDALYS